MQSLDGWIAQSRLQVPMNTGLIKLCLFCFHYCIILEFVCVLACINLYNIGTAEVQSEFFIQLYDKYNKIHTRYVRPIKTQLSLAICQVWPVLAFGSLGG